MYIEIKLCSCSKCECDIDEMDEEENARVSLRRLLYELGDYEMDNGGADGVSGADGGVDSELDNEITNEWFGEEVSGIDESWSSIMRNIVSLREHVNMEIEEDSFIRELFSEFFDTDIPNGLEDVKITLSNDEFNKIAIPVEHSPSKCAICLEEGTCTSTGGSCKLPCSHLFHSQCIKYWLTKYKVTCPVCRMDVRNLD